MSKFKGICTKSLEKYFLYNELFVGKVFLLLLYFQTCYVNHLSLNIIGNY